MERFGKSVSFGIGVNCGDAVVGNIGCDFNEEPVVTEQDLHFIFIDTVYSPSGALI